MPISNLDATRTPYGDGNSVRLTMMPIRLDAIRTPRGDGNPARIATF